MKQLNFFLLIATITLLSMGITKAQDSIESDSTGLPGDHFSLQGALEMFKKSSSPEDFEKMINSEDNHVNNLDLNADGDIDYIKVIDKSDGDVHAFVLQVIVSETENQDIAVIEMEKTGKESVTLQIIGDEDIYGEQTIVEPAEDKVMHSGESMEPKKKGGPNGNFDAYFEDAIVINVWPWPCVRFVYGPVYRPWVSPVRWRVYPNWWKPWRPLGWRVFHPFRARYHSGFAVVKTHRVVRAHRIYTPVRVTSGSVKIRHSNSVHSYRVTKTKTKVTTGPRGNTKVKTTRTTTRVKKR
ncbi:MAG: hypothetical protein IPO86_15780 [Saprospiraceae bacterium]|nr:hypothetical protein [Saprospiraceae bacterium]